MTYTVPPLRMPGAKALKIPITRPFNLDRYCVLGLLPEINTKWIDYSGNSNHATLTNRSVLHSGRYGPALYFNATNTHGAIADSAELRLNTAFSISIWAKRLGTSSDTYGQLMAKAASSTTRNYSIYWYDTGKIYFRVRDVTNAVERICFKGTYAETGIWRHLCGVYDGTNITMYVDSIAGTPVATVGTPYTGVQGIVIGKLSYAAGSGYYFNGLIDEMLIFNRELNLQEIQAITNMGKSP